MFQLCLQLPDEEIPVALRASLCYPLVPLLPNHLIHQCTSFSCSSASQSHAFPFPLLLKGPSLPPCPGGRQLRARLYVTQSENPGSAVQWQLLMNKPPPPQNSPHQQPLPVQPSLTWMLFSAVTPMCRNTP